MVIHHDIETRTPRSPKFASSVLGFDAVAIKCANLGDLILHFRLATVLVLGEPQPRMWPSGKAQFEAPM